MRRDGKGGVLERARSAHGCCSPTIVPRRRSFTAAARASSALGLVVVSAAVTRDSIGSRRSVRATTTPLDRSRRLADSRIWPADIAAPLRAGARRRGRRARPHSHQLLGNALPHLIARDASAPTAALSRTHREPRGDHRALRLARAPISAASPCRAGRPRRCASERTWRGRRRRADATPSSDATARTSSRSARLCRDRRRGAVHAGGCSPGRSAARGGSSTPPSARGGFARRSPRTRARPRPSSSLAPASVRAVAIAPGPARGRDVARDVDLRCRRIREQTVCDVRLARGRGAFPPGKTVRLPTGGGGGRRRLRRRLAAIRAAPLGVVSPAAPPSRSSFPWGARRFQRRRRVTVRSKRRCVRPRAHRRTSFATALAACDRFASEPRRCAASLHAPSREAVERAEHVRARAAPSRLCDPHARDTRRDLRRRRNEAVRAADRHAASSSTPPDR